jgi:hypothetical protein
MSKGFIRFVFIEESGLVCYTLERLVARRPDRTGAAARGRIDFGRFTCQLL